MKNIIPLLILSLILSCDNEVITLNQVVSNKKIIVDFIVIEDGSTNEFTVDTSNVVTDFSESILSEIRTDIEIMAEKLDLVDGLIHNQSGEVSAFKIGVRIIGDV